MDFADGEQNYTANPDRWSTGLVVENVNSLQTECGSAMGLNGAEAIIRNVLIDTAGEHVHAAGCAMIDNDGDIGAWSDGITFTGPGHLVTGNTIINASDVGIVFFGGKNTTISDNTVRIEVGNYGAFAGIALHPWGYGNNADVRITGNIVASEGDNRCGGLHAGINVGSHMWGGGCVTDYSITAIGNSDSCSRDPEPPNGAYCTGGSCQIWTHIPSGARLFLEDNFVVGAHINYLIGGVEGEIVESNNLSAAPQLTDWEAARFGCHGRTWGPLDKVAHHPSLAGWTELLVHCER
jgi:parallel beta-helix repeat protein